MTTIRQDVETVARFAGETIPDGRGFLLFVFEPAGELTRQECISDMDPEFLNDFLRQLVASINARQN